MHAQAEERALHITENRRQRRHGDRNDVGKRALRNSNRLREKLLHGGSFFWFGDRLHTTCRQKEPPPQLIRSTDSGTSPEALTYLLSLFREWAPPQINLVHLALDVLTDTYSDARDLQQEVVTKL